VKSDREILYNIPYTVNLKRNYTNELTYKMEWGEVRKDTYEGKREEFGMDMYMLLHLKWIINKDLLYSTGKSTQHYIAI